jgi:hypothetical protein
MTDDEVQNLERVRAASADAYARTGDARKADESVRVLAFGHAQDGARSYLDVAVA